MKVQIAKGSAARRLTKYFKEKGFSVRLSKHKGNGRYKYRWVKFANAHEKLFFVLAHGDTGQSFIAKFEIETGISCTAASRW